MNLSPEQSERFSRQILLPEIGEEGQGKLHQARVLLIGVGGLGSPAALYLAAAGVGTIGLVDSDLVELSNLHRQILFTNSDIGKPKAELAAARLKLLDPSVEAIPYNLRLKADNIMPIIKDFDLIIDGSDNFPTRYLVNDACVLAKKTLVHGTFLQFEGQVTIIKPFAGHCYRCLFPDPPPAGSIPSCREAGALGALTGVIGTLMATEALKLILGIGDPLVGRLLRYSALAGSFRETNFFRNQACPLCGENPTIRELIDYDWFCSGNEVK